MIMPNVFLASDRHGNLARPLAVVLGVLSIAVCGLAWFVVWRALPREAWLAQLALPVLLGTAVPGLFLMLSLTVKIAQGGRVRVEQRG